jgi:hypothetical protein
MCLLQTDPTDHTHPANVLHDARDRVSLAVFVNLQCSAADCEPPTAHDTV